MENFDSSPNRWFTFSKLGFTHPISNKSNQSVSCQTGIITIQSSNQSQFENLPAISKSHNHIKSGLAGGIAGCLAKTFVSPLDRVKILFQTANPRYSQYAGSVNGVFRALVVIWNESGPRGLLQGHSATLLRIFPYAGIKFMSYDILHEILMPQKSQETPSKRFLAGALSGVMAVFVTYPLEITRVRTAIELRKSDSQYVRIREVIKSIYLEHPSMPSSWDKNFFERFPLAKFYRGFAATICGMIPYAGTSFLVWGTLPAWLPSSTKDNVLVNLLSGSLAGMMGQTVSYPLEIVRRKMQVGGPTTHQTILNTTKMIYTTHGLKGFFVGLSIGYIKIIPMTAISFVTWSKLKIRFE
ncbi:hypothetical protein O181_029250 [Austropuccinia psidii MF-1]|uniref:Mitochondrial carrier protein n=1 Tax=Austropuccinia psidii MF-1 TaxID=1389203 RepID=A0A9Q3H506_9BASI|nr:hypothetical protein [Austropuccinia psidii MF-1]